MRKRLLGSVALLSIAAGSVVHAAPPAPVPPAFNWTGFYVGANVGYSWGRSDTQADFNRAGGGLLSSSSNGFNLDGAIGGLQFGYNRQVQNWLWGLETDFQFAGQGGNADSQFACAPGLCLTGQTFSSTGGPAARPVVLTTFNQRLDWFGTLRGRVGYFVTPMIVGYATGGLAYGHIKTDGTISGQTGAGATTTSSFSGDSTNVGWTVGAGIEGYLGGNWTGKVEYLYMDLGSANPTGSLTTNFIPLALQFNSKITDNIVRVGLNYKFQ
jgi:outer membrane immunogenic protein